MVGQSHSTVEIGQCRWREGDCIVKVLLRTHYPYSGTEEDVYKRQGEISQKGYVTVSDPACGSGALLLSFYETVREMGITGYQV